MSDDTQHAGAPGALDAAAAADFALSHRPSFSIRTRIALSFFLCFLVIGGVTLASSLMLRRIEQKLHFLEVADRYTSHIQQARRYEKNYLLYGSDLASAQEHVREARRALSGAPSEIERAIGRPTFAVMMGHLDRYEQLLLRLGGERGSPSIEAGLREHGGEMVDLAMRVVDAEQRNVRRMLRLSKQIPIVALCLLVVLAFYVTYFLSRQILRPLGRMVRATGRIAEGDFSPMQPARRYRDEFTGLALAINRMAHELERRQQMLAEAQKLRAIGTLTAGVAHELNNPLNNISLTAEALLEDYPTLADAERLELCRDLLGEAGRAQGVVRNLLDFARQHEVAVAALDLATLVRDTTRLVANQSRLAGVRLDVTVAAGLPPVQGDRQQLSQVLVNLVLNALDATPRGGEVRIGAEPGPRSGFVAITVADTGSGIAPEALPYIFDPFFTTKGARGTGLGLSVSYGIIAKHGGSIEVASQVGHGTTFTVLLPVTGGATAASSSPQAAGAGAPG
jgi:signal transduction histidine kinase